MTDDRSLNADLDDESDRLQRHWRFLEDFVDPDYGLLDQLLEMGTLTRRDVHVVKSERTYEKRNGLLLEYVSQHKCFEKFMLALRNTNQRHIANYLISDGVLQDTFGAEWPLTESQIAALTRNQLILIDSLYEIDSLSIAMFSADVINRRHKETLHSQPTNHEKSQVLLDMMARHSQASYLKIINCLEESNMHFVANILRAPGVVTRVISNLETSDDGKSEMEIMERTIADTTNNLLRDGLLPPEMAEDISELKSLGLIGSKYGHSVAFYFNCESSRDLDDLWQHMLSGRLKDLLDKYVNRVLSTEHQYEVRLKWSADDYAVRQSILNEVAAQQPTTTQYPTKPTGLREPKEVVDPSPSTQLKEAVSATEVGMLTIQTRLYGVAKLGNFIYALSRSPNAVHVFSDQPPYTKMPNIKIDADPSKFEGYDIGACSVSSCLYISDACGNRIVKIPLEGPHQTTIWLSGLVDPPWTLSVCHTTGDVLLARNGEPSRLELYDSSAVKIRSVELAADVLTPRHAVSTSIGRFIVIHKWKDSGTWGLSEVNREGGTFRCFKHEEESRSLCNPWHLALDNEDGVLVLDQMKKQVVRFDRDLNWQDIVPTKDELQQPLRLCYDRERRQLVVGQENGSLRIYSIYSTLKHALFSQL